MPIEGTDKVELRDTGPGRFPKLGMWESLFAETGRGPN